MQARKTWPDNVPVPVDTARGRSDRQAMPRAAADPRLMKFGIAAALGLVAGTMLFATEAQGRAERRRERHHRR